jgi:hypothetical protein
LAVVALVVLVGMTVFAGTAFGAAQTRIQYGWANNDLYTWSPTTSGTLTVTLSWTGPGGVPAAPLFPQYECDGLLFTPDYVDNTPTGLYSGSNPESDTWTVRAGDIGQTFWIGVSPYVGDIPYTLDIKLNGIAQPGWPKTGNAYPIDGEFQTPALGEWRTVFQYFPGTLTRTSVPPTSNVWGSWDVYGQERVPGGVLRINDLTTQYVVNGADAQVGGGAVGTDIQTYNVTAPFVNAWWNINQELWGTADRTGTSPMYNTWNDIVNDTYMKPAGQPDSVMPMQATYSFQTADANPKTNYQWPVVRNTSASERAYSTQPSTAGVISASFYTATNGTITWVYRKGSLGGSADIYIDGTDVGHRVAAGVSCYNAASQWKQTWTSGALTAGAHTIYVMNSGLVGAGGGTFIYHDNFQAPHDSVEADAANDATYGACRNFENNMDGMTLYKPARPQNAAAHGGYYSAEPSTAGLAAFTFSGASIDLVYRRGSLGGSARVYIDGYDKGTVGMYNATTQWWNNATSPAVTAYTGLGTGTHTIMVANTGVAGAGGGTYVYIDAFRYPSGTGTYYEEWDYTW